MHMIIICSFLLSKPILGTSVLRSVCTYTCTFIALYTCIHVHVWPVPSADPSLNINNLLLVLTTVKDLDTLGRFDYGLGIPHAVRDEIRNSSAYKTEEEKKEALLLYYINTVPVASWANVAGALHGMGEERALQAAKLFLQYAPAG